MYLTPISPDFGPVEQIFTFQSNDPLCESVLVENDTVVEDTETFLMSVSSTDPDVNLGQFPSAVITVLDDDGNISI